MSLFIQPISRNNYPVIGVPNQTESAEDQVLSPVEQNVIACLRWTGAVLAVVTVMGMATKTGAPSPSSPSPLAPFRASPNNPVMGAASHSALQTYQPFSQVIPPSPAIERHTERGTSRQEIAKERFRVFIKRFHEAVGNDNLNQAIALLVGIEIEVEFFPERLRAWAFQNIAQKADDLAARILRIPSDTVHTQILPEAIKQLRNLLERSQRAVV